MNPEDEDYQRRRGLANFTMSSASSPASIIGYSEQCRELADMIPDLTNMLQEMQSRVSRYTVDRELLTAFHNNYAQLFSAHKLPEKDSNYSLKKEYEKERAKINTKLMSNQACIYVFAAYILCSKQNPITYSCSCDRPAT